MRLLLLLSVCFLATGCSFRWYETRTVTKEKLLPHSYTVKHGHFTITQDQRMIGDKMSSAVMSLEYTNTGKSAISFGFDITFDLQPWETKTKPVYNYHTQQQPTSEINPGRYNGRFVYTNAVIDLQPGRTFRFGVISERIVNLNDGTVTITTTR